MKKRTHASEGLILGGHVLGLDLEFRSFLSSGVSESSSTTAESSLIHCLSDELLEMTDLVTLSLLHIFP